MTVHYVKKVLKINLFKDIVSFKYFSITIKLKSVTIFIMTLGAKSS